MGALPKIRRSSRRKRNRRSQPWAKAKKPTLTTLPSGKRVPTHMVTPANPVYKGEKFLADAKAKKSK